MIFVRVIGAALLIGGAVGTAEAAPAARFHCVRFFTECKCKEGTKIRACTSADAKEVFTVEFFPPKLWGKAAAETKVAPEKK
jgi:hypothetical protein